MAFPTDAYCTVEEADVYLGSSSIWNDSTVEAKEAALYWGSVWIDANYTCVELETDPTNPSDTIKYANALLAEDYIENTLITGGAVANSGVKREKKKAGSVEKEIEYFENNETTLDPQENVRLLLNLECSSNNTGMIKLERD